nr:hypothetical protein [Tanacetum cinerariifolium]
MTLPNPQKHVIPTTVFTKSKNVSLNAARQVTAAVPKPLVTRPRQAKTIVTKPHSPPRRNINRSLSPKASTFLPKVTAVKAPMMVNTRTDADLSAAVQNTLQAMLLQIREEIREEFRTGSGSSNAGRNPTPVTIHTWLERFNKQKPHSFEKATVPVDAENWISHMEKIFDVMGCEDAFKTRLAVYKFEEQERLKREYHSIRQTSSETSTEFMQRFLRLAGFLGAAAGTEEEQAKNFQWGLRRSTLNHLMCMSYTDVAQVAS